MSEYIKNTEEPFLELESLMKKVASNDAKNEDHIMIENILLKRRLNYCAGTLEAINFLVNKDDNIAGKNLEHIRLIISDIIDLMRVGTESSNTL